MALRGTLTHRKTRRLALTLGIDPPDALGLMEALWNVAAEMRRPDGGVGRMSDDDLAMEMHSSRDGSTLIQAFVKARLLDVVDGPNRLVVHDWHEHSDDTTDVKLGRLEATYANGALPRLTRLKVSDREAIWAKCGHAPATNATQSHTKPQEADASTEKPLPEPVPVPEPVPEEKAKAPGSALALVPMSQGKAQVSDAQCERIYRVYPRHVGKPDAIKAIRKAVVDLCSGKERPAMTEAEALAWLHDRAYTFALSAAAENEKFTPYPATWFNAGRYHDDEREWNARDTGHQANRGQARTDAALEAYRRAEQADADSTAAGEAWDRAEGSDGRGRAGLVLSGT